MKIIYLTFCLVVFSSFMAYSQYAGGNSCGYSNTRLIQTICPFPDNANVFLGGLSNGFSYSRIIQNMCPPINNTNIFLGSSSDGFANSILIQICCPVTGSIYHISNDW